MRELLDVLEALTLGSVAILAGAQIYVAVGVLPAMKEFPVEWSVRLHQELLTWRPGRVFKPATTLALVAALAWVIAIPFASLDHPVPAAVLAGLALVALTVYGDITLRTEFPINREVRSWERGSAPAGYAELRTHWDARQRIKMICACFAFVCSVGAVLVSM